MPDPSYGPKVYQKQGGDEMVVANGGKITEEAGGAILGRECITLEIDDAGTAGSKFVVTPFAGTIVNLAAVNSVANAGTKTVLTAKLATVPVTAPAWEIGVTQAAGVASAVVPTAANTVAAGDVIEIATDGGSTSVMPTMITITILRAS